MEVSKKRKRDVDCPRITYDATTKVFDRLFKEESLEEMKNVVRKKLGLSSSLPVYLSQMREGKSVVLEDDDDFDAFYASVYSTPVAKIKVHFGDDQPPPANTVGLDAGFTDGPAQLLEPPTAHHVDDPSKKRKVTFVELFSEPSGGDVEEPKEAQQVALDDSSQPSPNFEFPPAPPEVPATIDLISAESDQAHETYDDTKKKTGNKKKENKKKGKTADPTLEDRPLGEQAQSDITVVEALGSNSKESTTKRKGRVNVSETAQYDATKSRKRPRTSTTDDSVRSVAKALADTTVPIDDTEGQSSKKSKHEHKNLEDMESTATDPTGANQADTRTKDLEEPERHTPFNRQADPSEVDRSAKEVTKSRKKMKVVEVVISGKDSNGTLSASKSIKSRTWDSAIMEQCAEKQDPQPSASGLEINETQIEKETKSSASGEGKIIKKSRRKEAPVKPPEASGAQDQALGTDVVAATKAAVDAILARNSLPSKENKETPTRSFPVVGITPIAHATSSSSPGDQAMPPNNAMTTAEKPKTVSKCPICDQTPFHVRSKCSIIKAGIRAMRQRIAELQRDTEGNDEERQNVIEELQQIVDKRSRRKTPAADNKSTNVKSTADKPVISPTPVADSPRVAQPSRSSQAVKPAKVPSQEIMPLPYLAESLAFGDVSSYAVQDLEALIRGPNVTLADIPSSDSSEGEEGVLEEEPEEVQEKSTRSRGRIQYPSSSEEEEEEASPFASSIIPLPIESTSELSNEDELSRSTDLRGDVTSFHEVNDLGSSLEVDKTGDVAVSDAYALEFAHLNVPEISEGGSKVVNERDMLSALDDKQVLEESEPETSDVAKSSVTNAIPQSDPIEASEKPESPQSSIVSIEDIHPLHSTPKGETAVRRMTQRTNSALVRKTTELTLKLNGASQTGVNGVNSINNSKSAKNTGGLTRITELPIPINPTMKVIKTAGVQTPRQVARAEEKEKADEQGPTNASQTKQQNGRLFGSKTARPPAKIAETPSPAIPSNGENIKTKSVTVIQNVPETKESVSSNGERSLASWAVLQSDSQLETPGMVDELLSSPTANFPPSARKPVNGVSKKTDPLFLHSESQQSFPYSQYLTYTPESEEEEEVAAPVVQTKSSSKFRSLTEIASQPTLFTPTLRLTQTIDARDEMKNLFGRARIGSEEESEDSDSESDSEAEAKTQTSHIPMSRRAG